MGWTFPINNGGQFHGIADSGIEIFNGDPIKGLTREVCQNSIDARVDSKKAVRVEFKSFEVDIKKLPQADQLLEYYKQAHEFCKVQNFLKATKYFERTIPILEKSKIQMLRISDFNTTGLLGADTAGKDFTSPWFRLVRSVGSSDKAEGSIGAFGSGKQACFSCSDLQTVFYSTLDQNGISAYQGVSKLIGFKDSEDNLHSDVGYYSEENSMPIYDQFDADGNFKRNEPGTDVYVVSFIGSSEEWKNELIVAVLDGFFYAVQEGHLIVEVGDISIDCEHISELIETYKENISKNTYDYYQVLNNAESTIRNFSCIEKDDVEIRMLLKSELHRKVAMIRFPGMKVFDKGNISSTVSFAGVCIIKGIKISKLLGGLENIQHNAWELSRYRDDHKTQKEANSQKAKIYTEIKKLFNELKENDTEGEIDPEIGDCIPDPMSDKEDALESIEDEVSTITEKKNDPVKPPNNFEIFDDDGKNGSYSDNGDREVHTETGYIRPDSNFGSGSEPGKKSDPNLTEKALKTKQKAKKKTKKKAKRIPAVVRYRAEDIETGKYEICITPQADVKKGQILINMAAETKNYKADIRSAEADGIKLKIDENMVMGVNIAKNTKMVLKVVFDYSDICSLEVAVYGY